MPIDLAMFADKLQRFCAQFAVTIEEISQDTGIPLDRLKGFVGQRSEPTGDEVLILSDFFMCDFRFFISNEKLASFEQTELLFRMHGDNLTREDRWAIQEFLFLCECQEFLLSHMPSTARRPFAFEKTGTFYKRHGQEAAAALRRHLEYQFNQVPKDIYRDLRTIGVHVFRRKLGASAISGLFVRHPVAGRCVLVNYSQDVFRQRFTAAHEAGHSILDDEADFVVSFSTWNRDDLSEVRANTFASHLLIPPEFLRAIPDAEVWTQEKLRDWSVRLMVNAEPLTYVLKEAGLITDDQVSHFKNLTIPRQSKPDPELPESLSPRIRSRKEELLQRGLSDSYVGLCFDGFEEGIISAGRLAEMLLTTDSEVAEIATLYGRRPTHGH
ncbi:MAG: ImmA/IrrE family metallo-endopeptidase [Candidatus Methylomirabilota bacterium]|jgi:Zn-dependent peptidase ImmA (M78 family)